MSAIVAFHEASSIFFGPPAHVEGTSSLPEAMHGENWRAARAHGRHRTASDVLARYDSLLTIVDDLWHDRT
jgi:hypothetical protein